MGFVGGRVWDTFWSWCCLVALKQEKGTGSFERLAFLDEAGMIPYSCSLASSIEAESCLSTRLLLVFYNRTTPWVVGLLTLS
jgi:hypothetical protein